MGSTCKRCGTCCAKGGPTLHRADLPLLRQGFLTVGDLITIREGEPVYSPLSHGNEASRQELIKVAGRSDSWRCRFFLEGEGACGIYDHRPLECRLLKCWDPTDLTDIVYQECLTRQDVLPADDKLAPLIEIQEAHCSFATLSILAEEYRAGNTEGLAAIERLVTLDLNIRASARQIRGLTLDEELVTFGRPLFKSLSFYQLAIQEGPYGIRVRPLTPSSG